MKKLIHLLRNYSIKIKNDKKITNTFIKNIKLKGDIMSTNTNQITYNRAINFDSSIILMYNLYYSL